MVNVIATVGITGIVSLPGVGGQGDLHHRYHQVDRVPFFKPGAVVGAGKEKVL
jgi:hypothetical protein